MCGLFGFYSEGGRADMGIVRELATLAGRRGPDAFGYLSERAFIRHLGRAYPFEFNGMDPGAYLLGHSRLATGLGNKGEEAAQPIVKGDWGVTHNGTIQAAAMAGITLETGNDSETIAHLLPARPDPWALLDEIASGGAYAAALVHIPTKRVHLLARNMPLWTKIECDVVYWCSIRPADGWKRV